MKSISITFLVISIQTACSPSQKDSSNNAISTETYGRVVQIFGGEGIPNVEVCISNDCSVSDANGTYHLYDVPINAEHSLIMSAEGLLSGAVPFSIGSNILEIPNVSLLPADLIESQFSSLGLDWNENTGMIAFSISNGNNGDGVNIEAISVNIAPITGQGPFYNNSIGLPSLDGEQTTLNGGGVFVNLEPNEYLLTYNELPVGCLSTLGWGGITQHRIPVLSDHISFARLVCQE